MESSFSSRQFAANPIGVFFDADSACDAQKAAANESLRVSVEKRGFVIVRGTILESIILRSATSHVFLTLSPPKLPSNPIVVGSAARYFASEFEKTTRVSAVLHKLI